MTTKASTITFEYPFLSIDFLEVPDNTFAHWLELGLDGSPR